MRDDYTYLSDREIAGSGIGTTPQGIAAYKDLQEAVYQTQPADTAAAQASADAAQVAAQQAQATADQTATATQTAQARADAAYALADTKVTKNAGPVFAAPNATPSRAALPAYSGGTAGAVYTQADVQALIDQVTALTSRLSAFIIDARANGTLKSS